MWKPLEFEMPQEHEYVCAKNHRYKGPPWKMNVQGHNFYAQTADLCPQCVVDMYNSHAAASKWPPRK